MPLTIKDPEANRLTPVTERDQKKASTEELRSIAERVAAATKGPYIDHAELLYDEYGLPN